MKLQFPTIPPLSPGLLLVALPFIPLVSQAQKWEDITDNAGTGIEINPQRNGVLGVGNRLYLLGGPNAKGVLVSTDHGDTFTPINDVAGAAYSLADGNTLNSLRFANGRVWVSGSSPDAAFNYLHSLIPGESEWQQSSTAGFPPPAQLAGFGVIDDIVWDAATGLYYCIAQLGGVWVSADGVTWEQRTSGFVGSGTPASVAAIDGTIFALRPLSGLRRSTNAAITWAENIVHTSAVDGGQLIRTSDNISFMVPGLSSTSITYMTPDKGESWVTVASQPPGMSNRFSSDGELTFTATQTARLLASANGGLSWQDLPTDGVQLNWPVWPDTDPTGVFTVQRIERQGDHLFMLGAEYINASFDQTPKIYRLDTSSLNFPVPFGIFQQPQSRGLLVGQDHALHTYASGNNVTYQWQKSGVDISGATSRTLVLDNVQLSDSDDYTCVINHDDGPEVSTNIATITVFEREDGRWDPVFDQTNITVGGQVHLLENSQAIVVRPHASPLEIYRIGADGNRLQRTSTNTTTASEQVFSKSLLDQNGNIILSVKSNNNTSLLRRYHPETFALEAAVSFGSTNSLNQRIRDFVEIPGKGYAVVGGFDRTSFAGIQVNLTNFALINYDFTTDTTFPSGSGPNTTSSITSITRSPNGDLFAAGGTFTSWSGVNTPRSLARISPDGQVHAVNTGISGHTVASFVHALDDGRILILFGASGARQLYALHADGSVDPSFNSAASTITDIKSVLQQPDGKIILVGSFTSFGSTTAAGYIRLNLDGTVDESFYCETGFSPGSVRDVTYDPRGYLYLSGSGTNSSSTFQGHGPVRAGPVRIFAPAADGGPGGPGGNTFANWPALLDLPEDQRGPNATPAGDNIANLIKFAIGVGPLDSAAGRIPQGVLESTVDDETYPTVCFTRDTTAVGVALHVDVATDLTFAADLGTTVISTEDLGGGLERVCVRSNARFSDHPRQFFRLGASEQP